MVKKVFNLIILDESGSMESLKPATISGFNELLQFIGDEAWTKPEQEQWIHFFSFNGGGLREQVPLQKLDTIIKLNEQNYCPHSSTPLYDAIGYATGKLRYALANEKNYVVLVTILTDGEENASHEFTGKAIHKLVNDLEKDGWVFTYIGTNQDVVKEAIKINIKNVMHFDNNQASMKMAMAKEKNARSAFYNKLKDGDLQNLNENFFEEGDEKNKDKK